MIVYRTVRALTTSFVINYCVDTDVSSHVVPVPPYINPNLYIAIRAGKGVTEYYKHICITAPDDNAGYILRQRHVLNACVSFNADDELIQMNVVHVLPRVHVHIIGIAPWTPMISCQSHIS